MTRNVAYLLRGGVALFAGSLALMLALVIAAGAWPSAALADDDEGDLNLTAYELQQEIEARQAAYAAARDEADAAAASIDEARGRIAELEEQIPAQQERSGKAARDQYKLQQQSAGVVDLLLSADDFYSFLTEFEYMTRISDANAAEMNRLAQLKDEILAEQDGLKEAQRIAETKADEARAAMEAAQEAQAEVQRRIEEEARAQAEIAAQAAALAEEPRDNDSGEAVGGGEGAVENPAESGGDDSGDAGSDDQPDDAAAAPADDDSVDGWAARIDAYLAGSPLAGQGRTFAEAALAYGVDPRLSPAISFTESSKGLYCFLPHNAWGWGSASWDSWEEAINDHVAGLARGYGGQLSIDGAKKYCPPNWQAWYDRTLAQMNMI